MNRPEVQRRPTAWEKQSFRSLLEKTDTFVRCVEIVTSRGMITETRGRRVLDLARGLCDHPDVHALSITDNPGGNAMVGADLLGTDLISRGQEVIIHLSCKDWNRNALQGRGWQLASEGFSNILALSGDYPVSGYRGTAAGVFDTDSVGLLKMFSEMNAGMTVEEGRKQEVLARTNFFMGAVVNNHKRCEREVMPQYYKLAKKIQSGAQFIFSQIGYDARKQDELLKYMDLHGLKAPVVGNVYVLSAGAARFFNKGNIPGVTVTDDLLAVVEKQAKSKDKGKAFFLELAARQFAIVRGLGYRGVYLGGHLKVSDVEKVFELEASYGEDDWKDFAREIQYPLPGEFYYLEKDGDNGLSTTEISASYLKQKTLAYRPQSTPPPSVGYRINRWVHDRFFEPGTLGNSFVRKVYEMLDRKPAASRMAHLLEQAMKIPMFDCRDCGDCSLPEIAYLCPESQCVKNQRNGPCGGTRDGMCEVGEKECIWSRAYERLKAYGEEEGLLDRPVVFKNGGLKGTSAWANRFLERDHLSRPNE